MHCIALLLHMYLTMHFIAYPCICIFLCIALHAAAYALSYALPLHMHFSMHEITCSCICISTCTGYLCSFLVSHFTCIKGFLDSLAAQAYKLQVVFSRQLSETYSFFKANTVLLTSSSNCHIKMPEYWVSLLSLLL